MNIGTPQQWIFKPKPKRIYTPLTPHKPSAGSPEPPIPEVEETSVVRPRGRPAKSRETGSND